MQVQRAAIKMKHVKYWLLVIVLAVVPFTGASAACRGVIYDCETTTDTSESGALQQQPGQVQGDIFDDTESFMNYMSSGGCAGGACSDDNCATGNCANNSSCSTGNCSN